MGINPLQFAQIDSNGNYEHDLYKSIQNTLLHQENLVFVGSLLQRAFQKFSNKIALINTEKSITYKELFFRAILLSKKLQNAGIQPRDKVALCYENSFEFYIAYFAIWQLGAIVVPINIFLHEKELLQILNDSLPSLVIASPTLHINIANILQTKKLVSIPILWGSDVFDWNSQVPEDSHHEIFSMQIYTLLPDELAVLLYTSGTTGIPKGVMLSSKNILANVMQGFARFTMCGMNDKERFFCVLPLFHVFAQNVCLWLPIMIGASIIVINKIDRKLILEGLRLKPTLFFGFPALYGLMCLMRNAPLNSIKIFISGADMLPDKIRLAFSLIYGRKICSGYGLSETSPIISVNHDNQTTPTHSVGKPLAEIICEIRDENGLILGKNFIGNLWIKGDNVMMGYHNAIEATQQVLVDGWLNTGDRATIDKAGKLVICGRNKDIIIHKGFNIYPTEVENVLLLHPLVVKVAVVGQDEPLTGQIPIAFVAAKKININLELELRTLCIDNLATYKVPRKFICLEDLPLNSSGKVDKKQLKNLQINS